MSAAIAALIAVAFYLAPDLPEQMPVRWDSDDAAVGFSTRAVGRVLFIVLGNYCGKLRRNFFAGIRTPWTLASEEVWARTHRVGGWLFVLAGFAVLATALRPSLFVPVVLAATLSAASIAVAYSLVLYWRLHGFGGSPN